MNLKIIDKSKAAEPTYDLNPADLGFGQYFAANMFTARFQAGEWKDAEIRPLENLSLHPASIVFHYGQAIFEGIKAYRRADNKIQLFRAELNARRFNKSALRLDMPTVPEDFFLEALKQVVLANQNFVPPAPGSVYLRPTMIGTEACLGVRSSKEYLFFILALPTGTYFRTDTLGPGAISVYVSELVARAAPGGTGNVKAAANYAVSLKSIHEAKNKGFSQVLYLDAMEHRYVEEMGGMNIFFSDGKSLFTPELSDTILEGVTRQSILELAPKLGIPAEQRRIDINIIKEGIRAGTITEALACGTGAICTGISSFMFSESGETLMLPTAPGPFTERVFKALTNIHFGVSTEDYGWTKTIA